MKNEFKIKLFSMMTALSLTVLCGCENKEEIVVSDDTQVLEEYNEEKEVKEKNVFYGDDVKIFGILNPDTGDNEYYLATLDENVDPNISSFSYDYDEKGDFVTFFSDEVIKEFDIDLVEDMKCEGTTFKMDFVPYKSLFDNTSIVEKKCSIINTDMDYVAYVNRLGITDYLNDLTLLYKRETLVIDGEVVKNYSGVLIMDSDGNIFKDYPDMSLYGGDLGVLSDSVYTLDDLREIYISLNEESKTLELD